MVAGVQTDGLAAEAGIQPGDVITHVNRKPVQTVEDFRQAIENQKAGEPSLFMIHRKGSTLFVAVDAVGNPKG